MTDEREIRIGIAGCGRIGQLHAATIAQQVPGARVSAVFDIDAAAAARVAESLGVPAVTTPEELVCPDLVDAIAVCSSTQAHLQFVELAAGAGVGIMCEKPISTSLAEVDRVVDLVEQSGVPFMVGFNRRFDPGHAAVRHAITSGEIGEVHLVRITSRDPQLPPRAYLEVSGGLFIDMAIHDLDMARFITGSPVVQVYAQGAVRFDPSISDFGDVDTAVIVLTHESGAITVIDNSRQAPYGYDQRIEALGSLGMAQSGNRRLNDSEVSTRAGTSLQPLQSFFLDRYAEAYQREWLAFTAYLRNGGPSPVSARDGRAPVVLAQAASESRLLGVPVAVDGG
jgi:myo-inositol 2-dehydrogenase/D-chiro-inositol 1-dehydrogenase